jgi:hypothetical protein
MRASTPQPATAPRRHRGRVIAWRAGWLLLAGASFCVSYVLLVAGGR